MIKKYSVLIALILIILLFLIFRFFSSPKEQPQQIQIEVTPTQIPISPTLTPVPTQRFDPSDADPNYPLQFLLPHEEEFFITEKYIAPLQLLVTKKGDDQKKSEEALKKWLEENEFILGQNKIVWQ